jgi:hypothetical protein
LNAEEQKQILEQAEASSLTVSEFIRRRALGKQIVPKSELITIGQLTRVLGELRRLGGLLKNIHVETRGRYSEDTRKAIQTLEAYVRELERADLKSLKKDSPCTR